MSLNIPELELCIRCVETVGAQLNRDGYERTSATLSNVAMKLLSELAEKQRLKNLPKKKRHLAKKLPPRCFTDSGYNRRLFKTIDPNEMLD